MLDVCLVLCQPQSTVGPCFGKVILHRKPDVSLAKWILYASEERMICRSLSFQSGTCESIQYLAISST